MVLAQSLRDGAGPVGLQQLGSGVHGHGGGHLLEPVPGGGHVLVVEHGQHRSVFGGDGLRQKNVYQVQIGPERRGQGSRVPPSARGGEREIG